MTRMCAWCSKVIGVKAPFDNPAVTHGMCLDCWRGLLGGCRSRRLILLAAKLAGGRARRPGRPNRLAPALGSR